MRKTSERASTSVFSTAAPHRYSHCFILCPTNPCLNMMFCLSYVCVCASCCWVELFLYTVVFYVCCGHLILSKFQRAKVLLSGLIFTCPVPSPAVTLRVKSTLLMEFIQPTKVCEQERYQITQTSHFLVSA